MERQLDSYLARGRVNENLRDLVTEERTRQMVFVTTSAKEPTVLQRRVDIFVEPQGTF